MIVWLDGKLIEEADARIAPTDRGFLLGDGIFETLLVRNGQPVFLEAHLDRLTRGARTLGFTAPIDATAIHAVIIALLGANQLNQEPRAAVRITLTRGTGPRGLAPPKDPSPTMLIACFASSEPSQSTSVITSSVRRNEHSPSANLKALPYLDQIFAKQEAWAAGAEDALLRNTSGKLVCASAANLFLWDSNTLITPPVKDGCLDGITRRAIIDLAGKNNIDCFEESITPSTLASVHSGFLTNALVGLQSLHSVDGRALKEHRLMKILRDALREAELESLRD